MTEELIKRLLPCPFCGGDAHLFSVSLPMLADCTDIQVCCDKCDTMGPSVMFDQDVHSESDIYDLEAEAISAWNTRLYDEVLGVGVERIQSEGASSDEDRAVAATPSSPQAVSPVPASIPSAAKELEHGKDELRRLMDVIWRSEYRREAPNWQPLDDLPGMVTQIDNMFAGVRGQRDEARHDLAALFASFPSKDSTDRAYMKHMPEERQMSELCRLYNHRDTDEAQFNRGQMMTAILHGFRLAWQSFAAMPEAEGRA